MQNAQPEKMQNDEAKIMRHDFTKSLLINSFFLIALIALYFLNRQMGFLDKWISKF